MARKLTGQVAEATTATPSETERTVASGKKWLPYTSPEDLPKADYSVKPRKFISGTGEVKTHMEVSKKKNGEPRYFVTPAGELIAVRKTATGIQRRMVYLFKKKYGDGPIAQDRQLKDRKFRGELKLAGIPGA